MPDQIREIPMRNLSEVAPSPHHSLYTIASLKNTLKFKIVATSSRLTSSKKETSASNCKKSQDIQIASANHESSPSTFFKCKSGGSTLASLLQPTQRRPSTIRVKSMASPPSRLLEILQLPGVSRETSAVLTSLLRRCADDYNLSAYVLQCVDEKLQTCGQERNTDLLFEPVSCPRTRSASWSSLVSLVAEALNAEANRWMSDFLLIGNDMYEPDEIALIILPCASK